MPIHLNKYQLELSHADKCKKKVC